MNPSLRLTAANTVRLAFRDAMSLLLPVTCVGCGQPDVALCERCVAGIGDPVTVRGIGSDFPIWAGAEYASTVRRALLALKNEQRTDVAWALGAVFRRAFDLALLDVPRPVGTVTNLRLAALPSSRAAYRRRGYRPVEKVLAKAGLVAEHPFTLTRQPNDQIGLGIEERHRNLTGSLRAARAVSGGTFVIVDDVITTGATVIEARRALDAAGARVVGAVVIAATRRTHPTQL